MKVMNYLAAAALSFGVATMAKAEAVEHFEGKNAESLEEAVTNFIINGLRVYSKKTQCQLMM